MLIAAAGLAPRLGEDPGYILIQFGSWTVETTVIVVVVGILIAFILLRIILWTLYAPARVANNLAKRRMERGLLALAEGNWSQAEKALHNVTAPDGLKRASYLAAASAASSQLDDEKAEIRQQKYLLAADDGQPRTRFLLELSRARLHITRHHYAQAIPILEQLRKRKRQHPQLLKMLAHCYREQGHWLALREILPAMRKAKIIDQTSQDDIQLLAASNELETSTSSDQLQQTWEQLTKTLRTEPLVLGHYAQRALAFGTPRIAETSLIKALDKQLDNHLLDLYFQCQVESAGSHLDKALAQAEKWRYKQPDSAAVERLLGQICMQQQLWGKARSHLLESLHLQPQQQTFQMLGELLERQGELESALHCYHNALQLSQGKAILYPDIDNKQEVIASPDHSTAQIEPTNQSIT